jgi:hypothetical protein
MQSCCPVFAKNTSTNDMIYVAHSQLQTKALNEVLPVLVQWIASDINKRTVKTVESKILKKKENQRF